jgi:uncharacterized membrane protein YfcA
MANSSPEREQRRLLFAPVAVDRLGFVSLIGVVMIAPVSSFCAPFGVRLAHILPQRGLEIGLGIFLISATARFLVSFLL